MEFLTLGTEHAVLIHSQEARDPPPVCAGSVCSCLVTEAVWSFDKWVFLVFDCGDAWGSPQGCEPGAVKQGQWEWRCG